MERIPGKAEAKVRAEEMEAGSGDVPYSRSEAQSLGKFGSAGKGGSCVIRPDLNPIFKFV
jgi:hypothetical protein